MHVHTALISNQTFTVMHTHSANSDDHDKVSEESVLCYPGQRLALHFEYTSFLIRSILLSIGRPLEILDPGDCQCVSHCQNCLHILNRATLLGGVQRKRLEWAAEACTHLAPFFTQSVSKRRLPKLIGLIW